MITLKKISVKAPENEKELFMMLFWDTNETSEVSSDWDHFIYRKAYNKMWIGNVNRNNEKFSIRRVRHGTFGDALSRFRIKGRLKKGIVSKTVEVELGLTLWPILELLMTFGFVATFTTGFFNDLYGWLLAALIGLIFVLLALKDFQISEEQITEYIKKPKNVSGLVVKSDESK